MPRHKKNYSRNKGKKFLKPTIGGNKSNDHNKSGGDRRKKNFRFIQRSKEAEELQRRQKIIEDKYKQNLAIKNDSEQSDLAESDEDENAFESLLSTLDKKVNKIIESSSDEENCEENDEEMSSEVDEMSEDVEEASEEEEAVEENTSDEDASEEEISKEELNSNIDDEDEGDIASDEEEEGDIEDSKKELGLVDPYSRHFEGELSPQHVDNLIAKPVLSKRSELIWPVLGKLKIEISKAYKDSNADEKEESLPKKKKILLDEETYAPEGVEPTLIEGNSDVLEKLGIKLQLINNVKVANKVDDSQKTLSSFQCEILSIISGYQDLLFPQRSFKNAEEVRFAYCLHALNHMLKTRAKIVHHNAKLNATEGKKKSAAIIPDSYRDQGMVRPKVLILLPFRDSAFRAVNILVDLMYGEKSDKSKTDGSVINYKRFMEEYTGDSIYFPKTNPKPEDYEKTFCGNTDDNFRIGISLTKKCIKLYAEFYSSDILIASPLGLRMVVGAAGDAERDYDFLSSIEVLILDQAELFLAQNWDHLLHVLDHMHLQPQSVRNTDFARVRHWCLNGLSRFYRQTLFFSSHELPEFRSLFSNKCHNYQGKVCVANPVLFGSIRSVVTSIPQVYHKLDVTSIESSFDARFKYFINEILPQFKSPSMSHCMIYIPSYFDYVRIRNYFKSETLSFVQICEYTKDAKIARARDMFFHSAAHFLLYSERAHFFRRTRIKGIRHLIMYQPPCWPHLYPELLNLMQESYQNPRDGLETSMSVTVLYTKYDMLQVSAIVGTEPAGKLLRGNKSTHVFMAGK